MPYQGTRVQLRGRNSQPKYSRVYCHLKVTDAAMYSLIYLRVRWLPLDALLPMPKRPHDHLLYNTFQTNSARAKLPTLTATLHGYLRPEAKTVTRLNHVTRSLK